MSTAVLVSARSRVIQSSLSAKKNSFRKYRFIKIILTFIFKKFCEISIWSLNSCTMIRLSAKFRIFFTSWRAWDWTMEDVHNMWIDRTKQSKVFNKLEKDWSIDTRNYNFSLFWVVGKGIQIPIMTFCARINEIWCHERKNKSK